MSRHDDRIPVWAIWLLILFGTAQPLAWIYAGGFASRGSALLPIGLAWFNLLLLGGIATRRIRGMRRKIAEHETTYRATLDEVNHLHLQNEMLRIIASSPDLTQAFQALASLIARLVPCDRIGLALLAEDGREFQTYTARVQPDERRPKPRAEVVFKIDGTALGEAVRTREPVLIGDTSDNRWLQYLDVTVLAGSGFKSGLIVPLVSKGRAIGTINLVSRSTGAFSGGQAAIVQPIAEILAVTWLSQQLQISLGRYRTMEAMGEATLGIAAEINSALQAVVGHCDLIQREYRDERLRRDLDTIMHQAQRIATLLKRMRETALQHRDGTAPGESAPQRIDD